MAMTSQITAVGFLDLFGPSIKWMLMSWVSCTEVNFEQLNLLAIFSVRVRGLICNI